MYLGQGVNIDSLFQNGITMSQTTKDNKRNLVHRFFSASAAVTPLSAQTETALLESCAPNEYSVLAHSQSLPTPSRPPSTLHSPPTELNSTPRTLSDIRERPLGDMHGWSSAMSYKDPVAASTSTMGSTLQPTQTQEQVCEGAPEGSGGKLQQPDAVSNASNVSSNAPQEKHHDLRRIWRKHGFDMPPSDAQGGFWCLLLFLALHGFGMQLPALLGISFYILCGVSFYSNVCEVCWQLRLVSFTQGSSSQSASLPSLPVAFKSRRKQSSSA